MFSYFLSLLDSWRDSDTQALSNKLRYANCTMVYVGNRMDGLPWKPSLMQS
jgi:hypothetical protein